MTSWISNEKGIARRKKKNKEKRKKADEYIYIYICIFFSLERFINLERDALYKNDGRVSNNKKRKQIEN